MMESSRLGMSRIGLWLVLAVCCVTAVGSAADKGTVPLAPQASYDYHGEKIPLAVEPGTISVGLYLGNDLPARQDFASPQGAVPGRATRLNGNLWRVNVGEAEKMPTTTSLSAPAAVPNLGGTKPAATTLTAAALERQHAVLQQLQGEAAVEWAYPAYRNIQTGTLLLLTPQVIVKTASRMTADEVRGRLPDTLRLQRTLTLESTFVLELTTPGSDDPLEAADNLAKSESWVQWAEPDFIQEWSRDAIPDDPLFPDQWHLQNTGQGNPAGVVGADARLPAAWDTQTGDGTIVIAVVDDGIQLAHPDLASRIWTNPGEIPGNGIDDEGDGYVDDVHGWDFVNGDNDPNPDLTTASHGTAVAGVAAAAGNNGIGVSGACQNCKLLSAKVFSGSAAGTDSQFAEAIVYAGAHADVLNDSWGGGSPSSALTAAIQGAVSGGRGGLGAPTFFSNGNFATGYVTFTLTGFPTGTYTFTWTYHKDSSASAGFDTAWLDNVIFPDGAVQDFETCSALPTGWTSSGNASWVAVNDGTRASSARGGTCSIRAGAIADSQVSSVSVTRTLSVSGDLQFSMWPSSETKQAGGEGPINTSGNCYDYVDLTVFDGVDTHGPFFPSCGTWSNQNSPLQDGTLLYPSSLSDTISVGGATNFDLRSDYAQWGPGTDFVCHTSGGSLGITTTDVTGSVGYTTGDYTSGFGGTSSAAPLCTGIGALALSEDPTLTAAEVRTLLRSSARKIGTVPYVGGSNDQYGYGAVSAQQVIQGLIVPACPYATTLDLSGQTVTTTETFGACDTLTAGPAFAVESPGNVTFVAGNMIVLDDGFSVGPGATFTAELDATLSP